MASWFREKEREKHGWDWRERGRIMDLNALAQLSALVVAVLNAHADPLTLLNPHPDILTSPHNFFPFKLSLLFSLFIICSSLTHLSSQYSSVFSVWSSNDARFFIAYCFLRDLVGTTACKARRDSLLCYKTTTWNSNCDIGLVHSDMKQRTFWRVKHL